MNRSVMIVICDFLLLMLVASARFDEIPSISVGQQDRVAVPLEAHQTQAATAAKEPTLSPRTAEVLNVMKSSLEEERLSREQMAAMLSQTQDALELQRQLAAKREEELRRTALDLRAQEEQARQIEKAGKALATDLVRAQGKLGEFQKQVEASTLEARLSQQRLVNVEAQYAKAQTNLVQLEKQVSSSSTEARLARERLAQIEADLRSRQSEAEQARQRIDQADRLRQSAEIDRERIAGQLKVVETQKEMTQQQLADAKGQIATVQQEKQQIQKITAELAEGVGQFAEKQGELTKEIRENRPLTGNTIFAEFLTNRVNTDFRANRSGILGRTISKDSQSRTILVSDGTQTFAIYHIEDTPFRLDEFAKDWERFIVHLYRGNVILPIPQINFLSLDPRVIVAPVSEAQAKQLGVHVYKLTADPLRFQDALLIGADEGYYGECKFMLDARNSGYLKMDRSVLGRFIGKFNPSRGDLVFSKSGDLIGMMVNKHYCALLTGFTPTATIPTGTNLNADAIGSRLAAMQRSLHELPGEMQ